MFGYLLISNRNDVVNFGGNDDFKDYLHKRLRLEVLYSSSTPSTSSGVYTSSSTESLSSDESSRRKMTRNSKLHVPLRKQEVTHLFLPIISIYRSEKAIRFDDILSMISDELVILFKQLTCNYLLVSLGKSERLQRQFLDHVELGLQVNVGPLLGLLDMDPSSVTLGCAFLKSLADNEWHLDHNKVKVYMDVRKSIFLRSKLSITLPLLSALSLHLQDTLGCNKCLLVADGEILSSVSGAGGSNHFWNSLLVSDLNLLVRQISKVEYKKEEIFQVWLRSTQSIIPYYVDVMVYNNGRGFKTVCLFEAKYNSLIRTINVFLVQLDRIQYSDDVMRVICILTIYVSLSQSYYRETREIGRTVDSIAQQMLSFSTSPMSTRNTDGSFLKNPERTAYFFELQSLWQRAEDLLLSSSGCYSHDPHRPRSSTNISIGSLKSALSSASLNSSLASHTTSKRFKHSLKCEITMEYFRRHAVTILKELCLDCHQLTSPQKLAQFRKILTRVVDMGDGCAWSDVQQALASESDSVQLKEFMSPVGLGLDMVAYSVTNPTKSTSVTYTPEWVKNEFDTPLKSSCRSAFVSLLGKSGKRYSLVKVKRQRRPRESWPKIFKSFRTLVKGATEDCEDYFYAMALFEEGINSELIHKQMLKLIDIVCTELYSVSHFFH